MDVLFARVRFGGVSDSLSLSESNFWEVMCWSHNLLFVSHEKDYSKGMIDYSFLPYQLTRSKIEGPQLVKLV